MACHCNEYAEWQKVIVSNDQDFYSCVMINYPAAPGKNEQVLNKNKVLEEYGIHPRNFAWARAIVGDKSDNLDGVKGLGLKTVSKDSLPFGK